MKSQGHMIDYDNKFEENFDQWKALGYLKGYPMRRLKIYFVDDMKTFVKPIDSEVLRYDRESSELMDKYIDESEEILTQQIPF